MTALARRPRSRSWRALTSASSLAFAALLGILTAVLLDGCSPGPRRVADRPRDLTAMANPSRALVLDDPIPVRPIPVRPIPVRRSTSRPVRSEDWARVLGVPNAGVAMATESRLLRAVHTRALNDRVRLSSFGSDRLPQPVDLIPRDTVPEPEPVAVDPIDDDVIDIDPENVVDANAPDTDPAELEVDPAELEIDPSDVVDANAPDTDPAELEIDPSDIVIGEDVIGEDANDEAMGDPDGLLRGGPPGGGDSVGGILDILKKAVGLGGSGSSVPTSPPAENAADPNDDGDVESDSGADPAPSGGADGNRGFKNVEPANDARADEILKKLGSQGRRRAMALMKEARSLYEAGDYDAAKKTALEAHVRHPAIASEAEALIQQIERSASRG